VQLRLREWQAQLQLREWHVSAAAKGATGAVAAEACSSNLTMGRCAVFVAGPGAAGQDLCSNYGGRRQIRGAHGLASGTHLQLAHMVSVCFPPSGRGLF